MLYFLLKQLTLFNEKYIYIYMYHQKNPCPIPPEAHIQHPEKQQSNGCDDINIVLLPGSHWHICIKHKEMLACFGGLSTTQPRADKMLHL